VANIPVVDGKQVLPVTDYVAISTVKGGVGFGFDNNTPYLLKQINQK
jgi:hypothetical protein